MRKELGADLLAQNTPFRAPSSSAVKPHRRARAIGHRHSNTGNSDEPPKKGSEAPSQAATRHHHTHNSTLSPPLRSPDCASKKEHDTDVSSPPESGDLGFHLAGNGRRGRRILTTASREGYGAQAIACDVAAPARGFPRIQPHSTRSALPTPGKNGLSH